MSPLSKQSNKKQTPLQNKQIFRLIIPAVIVIAVIFLFFRMHNNSVNKRENMEVGTSENQVKRYVRTYPIMHTWAQVTLYGDDPAKINTAMERIHSVFTKVDKTCNRFDPQSELYKLNQTAYEKPFKCEKILWGCLMQSKFFYKLSRGSFDVTATPLMKLWGFFRKQSKIPTKKEVDKALSQMGLNNVIFDKKNMTVKFKNPNIKIDLGGIAKGYAVDLAYDAVKDLNIKSGVINLAGNMRLFPEPPPGKSDYEIGIRNPLMISNTIGTIKTVNTSIATSGDYEQYVYLQGKRYTHIMDPATGKPVQNMLSAVIVAPSATWTDGLSTSVFIKGEKFARKIHKEYPKISILIMRENPDRPGVTETIQIGKIWKSANSQGIL